MGEHQPVMGEAAEVPPAPAAVRDYVLDLMKKRRAPGAQLAIVRNGRIECLDAFGLSNIEHRVPTTRESIFSVNSIAKAVTGVAVMQLVEAGTLDLSAPISTYIDEVPGNWGRITVHQLATATSGLPEIMQFTIGFSMGLIGGGSDEDAWRAAYALPVEFAPGTAYRYGQTNYALLGRIIDRLSAMPFTRFIIERQFVPAGMTHTLYADDCDIIPDRADTYVSVGLDGADTDHLSKSYIDCPPILRTAAGLHSTAEDLAKWIIALESGTLLERESSREALFAPAALPDGGAGVQGLGWTIGKSSVGLLPAPGGGAKAQVALYPGGLAVILITNLMGAIPEQFAPFQAKTIDLAFMDPIARSFSS